MSDRKSGIEIHRDPEGLGPIVTGFSGRGFRVRDAVFPGGLLLTPLAATAWEPGSIETLAEGDVAALLALEPMPEFLLFGTGVGLVQPPRPFVRALEAKGVGVETMDSRAAARAWGVLRAEERWIAAALMPL